MALCKKVGKSYFSYCISFAEELIRIFVQLRVLKDKLHQLQNGEKYCTNSVTPVSAQLIGRNTETLLFLSIGFEAGKTYFVSNFEESFEYPLGIELIDPNFGKQGKGCVCGIHFFIDKQSAIKYMSTGFTGIDYSDAPRMTFPFEQGDAKVVEC